MAVKRSTWLTPEESGEMLVRRGRWAPSSDKLSAAWRAQKQTTSLWWRDCAMCRATERRHEAEVGSCSARHASRMRQKRLQISVCVQPGCTMLGFLTKAIRYRKNPEECDLLQRQDRVMWRAATARSMRSS